MAVVCNNQLFYSVFGDTNGCDDADFTGEASYALANVRMINVRPILLTLRITVVFPGSGIQRRERVYWS